MIDDICLNNAVANDYCHNIGTYDSPERMDVIVPDDKMLKHLLDIDNNTLVLFDIDKTLVYSPLHVANDDCFGHIIRHHQQYLEKKEARDKTLQIHNFISSSADFVPVAQEVLDAFMYLTALGVDFMAVTSRDAPLAKATLRHLSEAGLQFPIIHENDFDLECRPNSRFEGQVIFSDAGHKGQCLAEFLQKINYGIPNKIIFFDDKEKNLHYVAETCKEWGIDFYGVRYSALDVWSTQLEANICHEQANEFINSLISLLHLEEHCTELHAYFIKDAPKEQHDQHDLCYPVMHNMLTSHILK